MFGWAVIEQMPVAYKINRTKPVTELVISGERA